MGQQPNGFWLCQATLTTNAAATTSGSVAIQLSSDGSTLSYAGDTAKGAYVWGALVQQTSLVPVQDSVIAWDQSGENIIDAVMQVYLTSPFASNYPSRAGYELTQGGIQVINGTPYNYNFYVNGIAQSSVYGAAPSNPVYLYYRKVCPSFTGDVYSATDTYAVDEQVYFTNSLDQGDFWKNIVATTAGQSPDTTPNSWERITLYETFLDYCVYQSYADWLIADGAQDKAAGMYSIAQKKMDDQYDVLERQMKQVPDMEVATHLTSRPTW
jgi:hypothetical protein